MARWSPSEYPSARPAICFCEAGRGLRFEGSVNRRSLVASPELGQRTAESGPGRVSRLPCRSARAANLPLQCRILQRLRLHTAVRCGCAVCLSWLVAAAHDAGARGMCASRLHHRGLQPPPPVASSQSPVAGLQPRLELPLIATSLPATCASRRTQRSSTLHSAQDRQIACQRPPCSAAVISSQHVAARSPARAWPGPRGAAPAYSAQPHLCSTTRPLIFLHRLVISSARWVSSRRRQARGAQRVGSSTCVTCVRLISHQR